MNRYLVLLLIGILLLPFYASANVDITDSIELVLPNDGSTYTLHPGNFTTLTINNTDFSFSVPGGGSVELSSADKKNLSNDQSVSVECKTNESRVFFSNPSGESAKTFTVTPSGTCSSSSGGGGGSPSLGGGGGGGGVGGGSGGGGGAAPAPAPAPVPTPAPSTVQKVAELKTEVTQLQEAVAAKIAAQTSAAFNQNLYIGDEGEDVRRLQELFATDKEIYPEGIISGYYGTLTANAIRRFQLKYGVIAGPTDLGNGRLGPATRAKITEVFAAAPVPAPAPSPAGEPAPVPSAGASAIFSRDLSLGTRNDDVTRLQLLLASDKEIYPEGIVSGYYGPLTQDAVREFQLKYGVISSPTDLGNGRVGPATRAKLAGVFGAAPAPAPAPVPAPAEAPALAPTQTPAPPPAGAVPAAMSEEERQAVIQTVRDKIEELTAKLLQLQVKLLQEQIEAVKGTQ